jgi:hypothetical protein
VKDNFLSQVSSLVWSYIFGPFLAFLPSRWRGMWFGKREIAWRWATIFSGIIEFLVGPVVLLFLAAFVQRGVGAALEETFHLSSGSVLGSDKLTLFSLAIAALHPLTWLGFYIIVEGVGRALAAAITEECAGTLLLVLPDRVYLFLKERIWNPTPIIIPDRVTQDDSRLDWQMKIEASRPKRDWDLGRLLLYKDRYYRIESCSMVGGPRPYVFMLRSLAAGVRSRSVILYAPEPSAQPRPALTPQNP